MLVAFCLAAYLPGLKSVPPLDGDEARYAEASRAMLAADSWRAFVVPHIDGAPRLNKPPLIYWLQAGSAQFFSRICPEFVGRPVTLHAEIKAQRTATGSPVTRTFAYADGIWTYRVPSVAATVLAVLVTWRLGIHLFGATCGWLGAALLAGSYLVIVDAHLARTDQALLLCMCLTQWSLWNVWRQPGAAFHWILLFWVSLGLGVLVKGPVTPAVTGLTIVTLSIIVRDVSWLRRLRWCTGAVLLSLVVLPWLGLVVGIVGWTPVAQALAAELTMRSVSAVGGRTGPPGYHVVLLSGLLWPAGTFVFPGFILAVRRGLRWQGPGIPVARVAPRTLIRLSRLIPRCGRRAEVFCLAWIVPAWIVCELIETKLPHYPLPLYPPIALLCARGATAARKGMLPLMYSRMSLVGDAIWVLIGLGLNLGIPLYIAFRGDLRWEPGVLLSVFTFIAIVVVLVPVVWFFARRKNYVITLLVGLVISTLGGKFLFQLVLPNLQSPWISSTIVRQIDAVDPDGRRPVAAVAFYRESLLFLTEGQVTYVSLTDLDSWLATHPRGLVIAPQSAELEDPAIRIVAIVKGYDYVEGRDRTLCILEATKDVPPEPEMKASRIEATRIGRIAATPAPTISRSTPPVARPSSNYN